MPTSSQNTNTIAMLPAIDQPQHAEAEQRQVLEEAVKTAATVQMFAVGQRHFVVGDVVQLIVHVADRVKVNASGDQRDHGEHADGQGIDVVADGDFQRAELAERVKIGRVGLGQASCGCSASSCSAASPSFAASSWPAAA